jgi:phosphate-selective porin OprO/OprP
MRRILAFASAALGIALGRPALAESTLSRIERLEQEIKILKREAEIEKEEAEADKKKQAKVEFGKKGLVVGTPDGRAQLGIRGLAQIDGRQFPDDDGNTGKDEIVARRLRPTVTGKIDGFSFLLTPDFAGGNARLFDAHIDYKFDDALQFRVGKFKPPVSLERLQSSSGLAFIERGFPAGFAPNRDFGFEVYGTFGEGAFEYRAGIFNGNPDGASTDGDDDDKKDYIGRVFVRPFKKTDVYGLQGLGFGVAGGVGDREGGSAANKATILGDYRSPGQQSIFAYRNNSVPVTTPPDRTYASGGHWRLYPQANYYYGPLGLTAEYAVSDQNVKRDPAGGTVSASLQHRAWQLYASYVLTGEDAAYDGVKPADPFNLKEDAYGAFEIAARIGGADFDDDAFPVFANPASSVSEAVSFGAGLNWHLNERVKLVWNYDRTEFEGGAAAGADRPTEHALFTRAQYQF